MKKYVLRHWRGNGQVIPDTMKDHYYDYPKHRNIRPYKLSECIVSVLTEDEYLKFVLERYGVEEHNKMVKKHGMWDNRLIKQTETV
jgi:hypothetical protein